MPAKIGITPKEAAEKLGVSRSTIYRMCKDKSLPGRQKKKHARIRILKTGLKKFKNRQRKLFTTRSASFTI